MRDERLIYDLGCHVGEDTAFYLKKGFRVVAVEANPEICQYVRERFAGAVADNSLVVVNKAIADKPGELTFYDNEHWGWGTLYPEWVERNRRLGAESTERKVMATTMAELVNEFGVPY